MLEEEKWREFFRENTSLHTLRLLCLSTIWESPDDDVMALEAFDRLVDNI